LKCELDEWIWPIIIVKYWTSFMTMWFKWLKNIYLRHTSFIVPLKLKFWNLNYGNEIALYEICQFPNRVLKQMVTVLLPKIYSWKKICLSHHMDLHKKFNLCVGITKCQLLNCEAFVIHDLGGWHWHDLDFGVEAHGNHYYLGSQLPHKKCRCHCVIIIIAPFLHLWNVCRT